MTTRLVSPTGKDIHLRPVRPNEGLKMAYRKRLKRLIAEMQNSVEYWLGARYKATGIAQDDEPANDLQRVMDELSRQWGETFDKRANSLGQWYARKALGTVDISMKQALKDAGFAVRFEMSDAMQDAFDAIVHEQVGLIKSIPTDYMDEVQGIVMRSVQHGRDLGYLNTQLRQRYGITKRRAELISRDQNNKATAVITRVRQQELGLTQAIWKHSTAGKHPRPSHVAANNKRYDVDKGLKIDGEMIYPGEKINCRCYAVSVIPGFND